MRKGQGISINVIVIAAIALLVLVILSTLVIRSSGNVSRADSCVGSGGTCISKDVYGGACDIPERADQWIIDTVKSPTCNRDGSVLCCRKLQ